MTVLVDVGNTRIKWAQLVDGRLTSQGSAVHRESLDAAVDALAIALPAGAKRIVAANVAGERVAASLLALAAERGAALELAAVSAERLGVRCAYEDPRRLGVGGAIVDALILQSPHLARALQEGALTNPLQWYRQRNAAP
jgi:type III pantothenate kinase